MMNDEINDPLDVTAGLEEFDNNIEFYSDLINGFLEHVEKRISVMEQAVLDKDRSTLKEEAHAIKGGAANLSAHGLANAAFKLEEIISKNVPAEQSKGLDLIKKEFARLKHFLINHNDLKL